MKKAIFLSFLILSIFQTYAQTKNYIDQPYLETVTQVDSLVKPDKIYININLNEYDSRNKKSTEELELQMIKVLKSLGINTEKNLSLLDFNSNFQKKFLSSQKILKTKVYSLLVTEASIASKVLEQLEKNGISNISIEKTEYSKAEELLLALKSKATLKAKKIAESLTKPLNQKVGKAIYISDINSISNQLEGRTSGIRIRGASSLYGNRASEDILIDFNKIKFSTQISIKFRID